MKYDGELEGYKHSVVILKDKIAELKAIMKANARTYEDATELLGKADNEIAELKERLDMMCECPHPQDLNDLRADAIEEMVEKIPSPDDREYPEHTIQWIREYLAQLRGE